MRWNREDRFQVTYNKVIFVQGMSFDSGTFILPLIYRPVILDADGRRRIYGESVNFGDKMPGNLNRKSSGRLDPAGKNPKFLCSPRTRPWWRMRDRSQGSSESNLTLTLRGEGEDGNVIWVSWRSANPPQLTLTDWHQVGVHSIQQLFALLEKRKVGIVASVKSCCFLETSLSWVNAAFFP